MQGAFQENIRVNFVGTRRARYIRTNMSMVMEDVLQYLGQGRQ